MRLVEKLFIINYYLLGGLSVFRRFIKCKVTHLFSIIFVKNN